MPHETVKQLPEKLLRGPKVNIGIWHTQGVVHPSVFDKIFRGAKTAGLKTAGLEFFHEDEPKTAANPEYAAMHSFFKQAAQQAKTAGLEVVNLEKGEPARAMRYTHEILLKISQLNGYDSARIPLYLQQNRQSTDPMVRQHVAIMEALAKKITLDKQTVTDLAEAMIMHRSIKMLEKNADLTLTGVQHAADIAQVSENREVILVGDKASSRIRNIAERIRLYEKHRELLKYLDGIAENWKEA